MRSTPVAVLCAATLAALLAGCVCGPCHDPMASEQEIGVTPPPPVEAGSLVGTWRIDLRPTPDSQAAYQVFVVESVEGKTFTGTFYGSEISEARLNTDWGAVYFSFVTADGSGPYLHSGVLRGGMLEGLTNSTGRDFLSVWTGQRNADEM